jgi:Rrf2 family iron-sulfur cluster assembly transcriptional regulator
VILVYSIFNQQYLTKILGLLIITPLVNLIGKSMRLTTKGRYAVTAMLDLALHTSDGPISLSCISERQGISLSYLEQLFSKLRREQLVNSIRGPGGGYQLNRETCNINVAQIIDAVNESIDATSCGGAGDCQEGDFCLTHHLWTDLSAQIHKFLSDISLAQLVERKDVALISMRQSDVQNLSLEH